MPRWSSAVTTPVIWESPSWLEAATCFLDEALRHHGRERTGPVTRARVRPWSALLEAPTSRGRAWLKAGSLHTAFEVRLYAHLHAVCPERVLEPLGLDADRGWIVLPDGGTLLGNVCPGEALPSALERVVPLYADLQLSLMPQARTLVSLGVSDMAPPIMPERFREALAAVRVFLERSASAYEWSEFRAIVALEPSFSARCAELAETPIRPSLDHNDLHPWNIFATPLELESARFFDWGDSVVAHPFASLLVLVATLRSTLEAAADDPRVLRVRDAYLEPFEALGSRRELVETADLACWVARAARALTWQRAIGTPPPADYAGVPFGKLRELLEAR